MFGWAGRASVVTKNQDVLPLPPLQAEVAHCQEVRGGGGHVKSKQNNEPLPEPDDQVRMIDLQLLPCPSMIRVVVMSNMM